ncbi:MAG: hypothetical protein IT290_01105 [Deltaproteobacteria bacterium]|nr:hypothetical protein [Deltaproteobacteria bacterium]
MDEQQTLFDEQQREASAVAALHKSRPTRMIVVESTLREWRRSRGERTIRHERWTIAGRSVTSYLRELPHEDGQTFETNGKGEEERLFAEGEIERTGRSLSGGATSRAITVQSRHEQSRDSSREEPYSDESFPIVTCPVVSSILQQKMIELLNVFDASLEHERRLALISALHSPAQHPAGQHPDGQCHAGPRHAVSSVSRE